MTTEAGMIPVLDWSRYEEDPEGVSARLGAACRDSGFFCLTGHGVPEDAIAGVFDQAARFFALPEAEKAALDIALKPHNRGWARMGSERLDETSGQVDRKEAFNVGLDLAAHDPRVLRGDPFRGVNVWPDLPGFRETLLNYYDHAWQLGVALHGAIARDFGLAPGYFAPHFTAPMATLRLLSYPPGSGAEGEIGAGAHSDYGSITLLLTDGEPGLQVQALSGDWIDLPHVPGAFVVNIGDCLMRWSNDLYRSTPHRVLPPARARKSVAFFLDPNPDSVIAALPGTGTPRYAPITGAAYLRSRLDATYKGD
ncbi:isopenicillin N synthase family dioxygenase [Mameliella alba]|uniref:isopenicillin N synthase family dioxygenase n=2 Tax=Mameliella alba TaxID=561184 RepID=UPI0020940B0E|nr:2-oxoglutarate and iron-dependent oxygenase domain-containing protein [Mameliella alba]